MKVDSDVLYDIAGFCNLLGITEKTARKLLREEKIKGKKLAKKWYVPGSAIKAYFENGNDENIEPVRKKARKTKK